MKKINIGHLKVSMLFVMVCLMVQIPLHASEIEGKAAGEKYCDGPWEETVSEYYAAGWNFCSASGEKGGRLSGGFVYNVSGTTDLNKVYAEYLDPIVPYISAWTKNSDGAIHSSAIGLHSAREEMYATAGKDYHSMNSYYAD